MRHLLVLALVFCGCADDANPMKSGPAGPSVCDGGPAARAWHVESLAPVGPASNVIFTANDALWVVESQQNTVSRWDGAYAMVADLDAGANPYDAAVASDTLWVTNYLAQTISAVDLSGGPQRTITHASLANPAGVAVDQNRVWVTNVNYLGPTQGFGPGSVSVFDTAGALVATIPLDAQNVQFVSRVERGDDAWIFVVATGAVEFIDGRAKATSPGVIYRWPAGLDAPQDIQPERLEIPTAAQGAPGRVVPVAGQNKAYLASATVPHLFSFDMASFQWVRGPEDPIVLYEADGDTLHHAVADDRGVVYVTAFNQDTLYRLDSRCDALMGEPIELGVNDELLEGPHGAAVLGDDVYFIMSIANSLGVVRFGN